MAIPTRRIPTRRILIRRIIAMIAQTITKVRIRLLSTTLIKLM
jgi:hypothetical protein